MSYKNSCNLRFFINITYKQHTEIKKKLSNILRLNFCYQKTIYFLYSRYHPKIIGDV